MSEVDTLYNPRSRQKRKSSKPIATKAKRARKAPVTAIGKKDTFLDENGSTIQELHKTGMGPQAIADTLVREKGLRPSAIDGKQISSWIEYRKKTGQIQTLPVSPANNNMLANFSDSCMITYSCLEAVFVN